MPLYETLIQWVDPAGRWHQKGEVSAIDVTVVFDLADLVKGGTLIEVQPTTPQGQAPPPAPPHTPPPAPTEPPPAHGGEESKP